MSDEKRDDVLNENLDLPRILEERGVSRRDFMKFCTAMSAALALPVTFAPKIAQALDEVKRPTLVWLEFQDCAGNTEALLRAANPTVAEIVLDILSVDYHETIMAAAGHQAEEALAKVVKEQKGKYIAVVEGSIPLKDGGVYCCIGGKAAVDIAREVCGNAFATITAGTCAAFGGIPAAAPNPTGAVGVQESGTRRHGHQPPRLSAQCGQPDGDHRPFPRLRQAPRHRQPRPAALRLRQADPRQLRAPSAFRRRPVRGKMGRHGPPKGALPLQNGVQGSGNLAQLPDPALQRKDQLAGRLPVTAVSAVRSRSSGTP